MIEFSLLSSQGADRRWCVSRSSKPVWGGDVPDEFNSHTLPPEYDARDQRKWGIRRFRAEVYKEKPVNLRQLEAFVKIANNKSFSATAKEMYLTQPTISAYISKLEAELGRELFVRTTKAVELSEDGQKIYLYAKEIVELAEKLENEFSDADEGTRQIVVSASSIPGTYLLPEILAHFSRLSPNVEFRVNETDSRGVVSDISEHRAEIGFCGTVFGVKNVRYIPFFRDELVLAVPNTPKYRKKLEDPGDLSWIAAEPWILRGSGSGTQREAEKLLKEMGIGPSDLHIVARINNTGAILLSVREGTGIAILSRLACEEAARRNEILMMPLRKEGAFRDVNMVISSVNQPSESCKRLIKFVSARYSSGEAVNGLES